MLGGERDRLPAAEVDDADHIACVLDVARKRHVAARHLDDYADQPPVVGAVERIGLALVLPASGERLARLAQFEVRIRRVIRVLDLNFPRAVERSVGRRRRRRRRFRRLRGPGGRGAAATLRRRRRGRWARCRRDGGQRHVRRRHRRLNRRVDLRASAAAARERDRQGRGAPQTERNEITRASGLLQNPSQPKPESSKSQRRRFAPGSVGPGFAPQAGRGRASKRRLMDDHAFGFRTRALHAGTPPDPTTGARAMPIYLSTSFVFDSTEHAAELFALRTYGNIYSRIGNPTVAAFEERMASLEGGLGAVATSSGLAAQLTTILGVAQDR